MPINTDGDDDGLLLAREWPPDFQAQHTIAFRRFQREHGPERDPKDIFWSSHSPFRRDIWNMLLIAYPSVALAMRHILYFFCDLEKIYLPLEEDENTGEIRPQSEADRDQFACPIQYFKRERHRDSYRLEAWNTLLIGDIHSYSWIMNYTGAIAAAGTAEKRASLRYDLRREMRSVGKPWPLIMESAVEEIDRRFDQLEQFVLDLNELYKVYKAGQRNHGPSRYFVGFGDESDSSGSIESPVELPSSIPNHEAVEREPTGRDMAELNSAQRITTAAEIESARHGQVRSRRRGNQREYPDIMHTSMPKRIVAASIHEASMTSRAIAYFRNQMWTWINVLILCTIAGILTSRASSADHSTSQRFDSNFFANLANLMLYIAVLIIFASRPRRTPHLIATVGFVTLTVIMGVVCVAVYPFSTKISFWASFVCQLSQFLSATLLIEEREGRQ